MKGPLMKEPSNTGHCRQVGDELEVAPVAVTLFGAFTLRYEGKSAGPWPRRSAKRLCELLMLRPGHRLGREVARDTLFAHLAPEASANALRKAVSMARQALLPLGTVGPRLLRTDRDNIWVPAEIPLEVDLVAHEYALRSALAMAPGSERDAALSATLLHDGVLLVDEPYSEWALGPRDALERLRLRARTELARDRSRGFGRSQPEAVIDAWEACLQHDPASEEAAVTLMHAYGARGQRQLVIRTYRRCCKGLEELGLKPSSALESTCQSATAEAVRLTAPWSIQVSEFAYN